MQWQCIIEKLRHLIVQFSSYRVLPHAEFQTENWGVLKLIKQIHFTEHEW